MGTMTAAHEEKVPQTSTRKNPGNRSGAATYKPRSTPSRSETSPTYRRATCPIGRGSDLATVNIVQSLDGVVELGAKGVQPTFN